MPLVTRCEVHRNRRKSVNPETFQAMAKPYHLKHLERVMEHAREIGMPIIPNFIFGHPLDNGRYDNFVAWAEEHRDVIPAVNVNFLSALYGATQNRRQRHMPEAHNATDLDQMPMENHGFLMRKLSTCSKQCAACTTRLVVKTFARCIRRANYTGERRSSSDGCGQTGNVSQARRCADA